WERPATAEDTTKTMSAIWISSLRLVRSASLPQIGVLTVIASRLAVTTQVYDDWEPPRSLTIFGSEVDTTVLDSIVTNRPSRRPDRASRTCRWFIGAGLPLGSGLPMGSGGVLSAT